MARLVRRVPLPSVRRCLSRMMASCHPETGLTKVPGTAISAGSRSNGQSIAGRFALFGIRRVLLSGRTVGRYRQKKRRVNLAGTANQTHSIEDVELWQVPGLILLDCRSLPPGWGTD